MKLPDNITRLIKRFTHSRFYKLTRYWICNATLPGNEGVPIADIVGHLVKTIGNGELWRASKGLAFSFLMALPPLLIFLFTLIAFLPLDGVQDELLNGLQDILPGTVYDRLASSINDIMGHKHKSMLSLGFVGSIILAANAIHGMMMYFSDRGRGRRTFIRRYPLCILIVFLLYIMIVLVLALLIGYKGLLGYLFTHKILIPGSFTFFLVNIGRWFILVLVGLFTITFIYYIIPLKMERVGFFSSGAVFAMVSFILLSFGFRFYMAHFNQYNLLYGSIGTVLVIMLWLFLNCLVLMLGYELNMAISTGKLSKRDTTRHHLSNYRRNKKTNI